jgi:hypothetical protein
MKLLPAHIDETQARYRLLGPKRDAHATAAAEPGAHGEASGRRNGFQAAASAAGDRHGAAQAEPPR